MIPKEAIDAAAKVIASHYGAGVHNWEWYLAEAEEILEAGAPYLTERAYNAGHLDGMTGAPNSNPYQSQAIRQAKEEAWDECEAAKYEIRLDPTSRFWEPYKINPYRKDAK